MAVPQLPGWQTAILKGINAPANKQTFNALDAWAQAEGGSATNNPFNTTQPLGNASSYNSVGVRNYQTPQQGIQATIQTLNNGRYQPIISALQNSNPQAFATALGNSPWGTSGSLVSQILGSGPNVPASSVPTAPPGGTLSGARVTDLPLAKPTTPNIFSSAPTPLGVLGGLQSGNLLGGIMSSVLQQQLGGVTTPTTKLPKAGVPASVPLGGGPSGSTPTVGTTKVADPVPLKIQTSVGPLHPTEGLPGFPAHDFFAPAGSPAVAPVTGTIVKLSGHPPADGPTEGPHGPFGWSVYVQGTNGRTYYMTHMGTRDVKVGETVKAGQAIGTVGDYAKYGTPSHIHMGVSAPGVSVS